jgi:hypothetical protein
LSPYSVHTRSLDLYRERIQDIYIPRIYIYTILVRVWPGWSLQVFCRSCYSHHLRGAIW